jgi:hypothetical protein
VLPPDVRQTECLGQAIQPRSHGSPGLFCVGIQTPVYHRPVDVQSSGDGASDMLARLAHVVVFVPGAPNLVHLLFQPIGIAVEFILSGCVVQAAPIQGTLQRSLQVVGPGFLVINDARRFFDPATSPANPRRPWNEDEAQ